MSVRGAGREGFVLIAVLWILAALSGLAGMYSTYVAITARGASLAVDRLRTEAAVYAALELAAVRLGAASGASLTGTFEFPLGDATVRVGHAPESARVDLNFASKDTLVQLFASAGAAPRDTSNYADRVIGWRSGGENVGQSAEAFAYASAKLPYPPREGPFQSVDELRNVLALPAWLVDKVLPSVTVFGAPSDIAPDAKRLLPVRLTVSVARAARSAGTAEVVIVLRADGEAPYDVLSWRAD